MINSEAPGAGRGTFRATISGVGRLGPIEERLGWRLVRIVNPASREAANLLRERRVTFIGPEGSALGPVDLGQARRILKIRLENVLAELAGDDRADAIRDGLARLRRAVPRIGRA